MNLIVNAYNLITTFLLQLSQLTQSTFKLDGNGRCQFKSGNWLFALDVPKGTSNIYLTAPLAPIKPDEWSRDELLSVLAICTNYSTTQGGVIGYDSVLNTLTLTIVLQIEGLDFTSFYNSLAGFESIIAKVKGDIDAIRFRNNEKSNHKINFSRTSFA
jgi:hypothetical protein